MELLEDLFGFGFDGLDIGGIGAEGFLETFTAINDIIYYVGMLGLSVFMWVLQARSLSAIAKRRNIRHPWLAWLPIAGSWVLGCISDQYRYVVSGETQNKRKWLPILSGVFAVLLATSVGYAFVFGFSMLPSWNPTQGMLAAQTGALGFMGLLLLMLGAAVFRTVIYYKALYDLYASCEPGKRVLFLLLSIFLGIEAIFIFVCRNKDLGMPPRKPVLPEPPETMVHTPEQE